MFKNFKNGERRLNLSDLKLCFWIRKRDKYSPPKRRKKLLPILDILDMAFLQKCWPFPLLISKIWFSLFFKSHTNISDLIPYKGQSNLLFLPTPFSTKILLLSYSLSIRICSSHYCCHFLSVYFYVNHSFSAFWHTSLFHFKPIVSSLSSLFKKVFLELFWA